MFASVVSSPPPPVTTKHQALGIQRVELVNVWLLSGVRVLYGKRKGTFFSKVHGSVAKGIFGYIGDLHV